MLYITCGHAAGAWLGWLPAKGWMDHTKPQDFSYVDTKYLLGGKNQPTSFAGQCTSIFCVQRNRWSSCPRYRSRNGSYIEDTQANSAVLTLSPACFRATMPECLLQCSICADRSERQHSTRNREASNVRIHTSYGVVLASLSRGACGRCVFNRGRESRIHQFTHLPALSPKMHGRAGACLEMHL